MFFSKEAGKTTVTPNCVGYYFSSKFRQPVFILPKVFNYFDDQGKQKAFGVVELDEAQALDSKSLKFQLENDVKKEKWNYDLLLKMPAYLYQAIDRYRKSLKKSESGAVRYERTFDIESSKSGDNETSLIDQCHSLIRFYEKNQGLITLVYKQVHSGFNKVNWAKTVRTIQPLINGDQVFYPIVYNHRKAINYDEELMILLFSTLRYVNEEYGYGNTIDTFYSLPSKSQFAQQVKQRAVSKRLRTIKNNYSSDVMRKLWHLLYALHSDLDSFNGSASEKEEFLFVKSFNNVFERMIDDLLGDDDFPKELKEQRDGKIIDHLFRHASLPMDSQDVYYVGDSKYYKDAASPEGPSRYKQFTYAKNIVQTQMNWSFDDSYKQHYLNYRDELTEGYSITPNFFIMGMARPEYKLGDHNLRQVPFKEGNMMDEMYQFKNRLFDRDTLFLMQYSVNFMFVLKAYTTFSLYKKYEFKEDAKNLFRSSFLKAINEKYSFDILFFKGESITKEDREEAIARCFRRLIGKIYCPSVLGTESQPINWLMMALEKDAADNALSREEADSYFDRLEGFRLGEDPFLFIANHRNVSTDQPIESEQNNEDVIESSPEIEPVATGMRTPDEPEIEILETRDMREGMKYNPFIPFFTIKGACGGFMDNYVENVDGDLGWIDASSYSGRLDKNLFVIQASGNSMLPTIEDGDYCVFEWYSPMAAGSRNFQIVLAKNTEEWDGDYAGHFTIKQYRHMPDGTRVLKPLNTEGYNDIPITEESEIAILAIYKGKLKIS